jgi:hypothetical protein
VLLVTVETTERVLAEHRLRTLRELAAELTAAVDGVLRGETYVSPVLGCPPDSEGDE